MKPQPDIPLHRTDWKFQLISTTKEWRREYSGKIEPMVGHVFLLRCDRLTGRRNVQRTSRYATHAFSGGWWNGSSEIELPTKEAFQLSDEEAELILDRFAQEWIACVPQYRSVEVLRWSPGQLV